jgi:hypothetical protein
MYGYNNGWFADNGTNSGSTSGLITFDSAALSSTGSQIENAASANGSGQTSPTRAASADEPVRSTDATAPARIDPPATASAAAAPTPTPAATASTPQPSKPAEPAVNPEVELRERFQQALRLESQNKLKESLAILEDLKKKTPISQIPREMHDAIQRIQTKIAQQSAQRLFDTP